VNLSDQDLRLFFEDRAKRTLRYLDQAPVIRDSVERYQDEIGRVQREGFLVLPRFFSREQLLALGRRFAGFIDEGRCLAPAKDRARKIVGAASESLPLRERVSAIALEDPLVNAPETVELAFDTRLLGMATAYFQTVPLLSYVKVRRSFVNAIPSTPTQQFHVDIGTYSIFKILVYLHDVVAGGGPFCYVRGSHRRKFPGWETKRFTREEMAAVYGEDRVVRFYAEAGDAIVVESTGFHSGEKPETNDRSILIVNYTVHPEYGFEYPVVRIRRHDLDALPLYARLVGDNLTLAD
jgi:Phytanoyl-CoA dioxygenase (PhyH)